MPTAQAIAGALYSAVMFLGHLWCHQLPERSPHVWGVQLPLCWRCSGIFLGATMLLIWLLTKKRLPPLVPSVILALLMPLDVLQAIISHGQGDNTRRLLTGILWGIFGTSVGLHLFRHVGKRLFLDGSMSDVYRRGVAAFRRPSGV